MLHYRDQISREHTLWLRYPYNYDPTMFIWLDETGCDRQHMIRKYGYSIRGIPLCHQRLLVRDKRYNAIPILSLEVIHYVYLAEGTMNGDRFVKFVRDCLLPHLMSFNGVNPRSVVIMDNASICRPGDSFDRNSSWCQAMLPPTLLP